MTMRRHPGSRVVAHVATRRCAGCTRTYPAELSSLTTTRPLLSHGGSSAPSGSCASDLPADAQVVSCAQGARRKAQGTRHKAQSARRRAQGAERKAQSARRKAGMLKALGVRYEAHVARHEAPGTRHMGKNRKGIDAGRPRWHQGSEMVWSPTWCFLIVLRPGAVAWIGRQATRVGRDSVMRGASCPAPRLGTCGVGSVFIS